MKVILTGGGTGGHIYPSLAIFEGIKKYHPDAEALYIGADNRLEAKLIPEMGIPFVGMDIVGFSRKNPLKNFRTIYRFLAETRRVKKIIKDYQPDYVVGTGGYVSGPVMYAAAKLGHRTFILENDATPGIANKFLSRYVDAIGVCFESAMAAFPEEKTFLTGNPRAQLSILQASKEFVGLKKDKKNVFVVLGSLGSETVNEEMIQMINQETFDYHLVFVTGKKHYELVKSQIQTTNDVTLIPYTNEIISAFKGSDLVVSRGGATTLSELLALGVPSIIIPSPYVGNNEQYHNAKELEDKGAVKVIAERNLKAKTLNETIKTLLDDKKTLDRMRVSAKQLGIVDAMDRIYEILNR